MVTWLGEYVPYMRLASIVAVVGIAAAASACTSMVEGRATLPAGTDPKADLMLTEDGFGIQIGKPFAPAAIEIFTEPQCTHCADFQFFFGTEIADYLDSGELVVTYRFLTFLDEGTQGYSHMVANDFFAAADPKGVLPGRISSTSSKKCTGSRTQPKTNNGWRRSPRTPSFPRRWSTASRPVRRPSTLTP